MLSVEKIFNLSGQALFYNEGMSESFGKLVKKRRKELGLTHDELVKLLGGRPTRQTIIKIEGGEQTSEYTMLQLTRSLELDPHEAAHAVFDVPMGVPELSPGEQDCLEAYRDLDETAKKHISWAMQQFLDALRFREKKEEPPVGRTKRAAKG